MTSSLTQAVAQGLAATDRPLTVDEIRAQVAHPAMPPPIPNTYWVVPGRLLAGEYPGDVEESNARQRLRLFLGAGFTFFLDLTEEGELTPYAHLLQEETQAMQNPRSGLTVEHCRMPIPDRGNPGPSRVTRILDTLDAALAADHRIYVHCWGGIGRTGTIIGCYLVRHGLTGAQALTEIARLRQGTPDAWRISPETSGQQARVRARPVGG